MMKRVNNSTFSTEVGDVEIVVGDEKQQQFYPRVKLRKWGNEVNFSIGVESQGKGTFSHEQEKIIYNENGIKSRFYEIKEKPPVATNQIRWIKEGYITPERIAAEYELDRHFEWGPTIRSHFTDKRAMMYYGYYPASDFIDSNKIDIPEVRLSATSWNDPMIMDRGLPLVDVHYDEKRDNLIKIHEYTVLAISEIVKKYGIVIVKGDNPHKLYFKDGTKSVKFFSGFWICGHYYYYINLDCDYNSALNYYKVPTKPRSDVHAYGLRKINKDIPDTIVDEIINRFAQLYGPYVGNGRAALVEKAFTESENAKIEEIQKHHTRQWVLNAKRDDVYFLTSNETNHDGFEFDITLPSRPSSNIYPLSITTKELDFYKQGELIPNAKSNYDIRSPRVTNSYAVYHKTKVNNTYQTGKAFHIYRPYVTDSLGKRVWAEMEIDIDKSVLNIILPEDFLNEARYPITIDPTFGYTTAGGTAYTISSNGAGDTITALVATGNIGQISSISGYMATAGSTLLFKYALYRASDGVKISETSQQSDSSGVSASWRTLGSTTIPGLTAISYWIAAWGSTPAGYNTVQIYFDTVSNAGKDKAVTYGTWPDPLTSTTTDSNKYSIYVNYTQPYFFSLMD